MMGFFGSALFLLFKFPDDIKKDEKARAALLAPLSIVNLPYSFKIFSAPLMDTYFIKKLG